MEIVTLVHFFFINIRFDWTGVEFKSEIESEEILLSVFLGERRPIYIKLPVGSLLLRSPHLNTVTGIREWTTNRG